MTALDQAFIKAFGQQGRFPAGAAPRNVVPLSQHLAASAEQALAEQTTAQQTSVHPPAAPQKPASQRVTSVDAPANPTVATGRQTKRSLSGAPRTTAKAAAVAAAAPEAVAPSITPAPRSKPLADVFAAFERAPAAPATANPLNTKLAGENRVPLSASLGSTASLNTPAPSTLPANAFSSLNASSMVVDDPQSTLTQQWTIAAEQWTDSQTQSVDDLSWDEDVRLSTTESPAVPMSSPMAAKTNETANSPSRPALFTQPEPVQPAATRGLKPAWQVDRFTWPKVCRRLISRAGEELDRLVDALLEANDRGQKVLGIAGCRRGEGATTMLLCAARRLGERDVRVALVDADLNRPRLAKRLGVQPQFGWNEAADSQGWTLDQAVVEASVSNVALLPIRDTSLDRRRIEGDDSCLADYIKTLRDHYDAVLVDLGPLEDLGTSSNALSWARGGTLDAVLLVHNERITSEEDLAEVEQRLTESGIVVAGLIENFVAT